MTFSADIVICRTSKMSHDGTWRASCRISLLVLSLHFEITFHCTRRDKSRRWLWRLVRPFFLLGSHLQTTLRLRLFARIKSLLLERTLFEGTGDPFMRNDKAAEEQNDENRQSDVDDEDYDTDVLHRGILCAWTLRGSKAWVRGLTSKMSHGGTWREACLS